MDFLAQYSLRITLIAINVICYTYIFNLLIKSFLKDRNDKKPVSPHGRYPYSRLKPSQRKFKIWNKHT